MIGVHWKSIFTVKISWFWGETRSRLQVCSRLWGALRL